LTDVGFSGTGTYSVTVRVPAGSIPTSRHITMNAVVLKTSNVIDSIFDKSTIRSSRATSLTAADSAHRQCRILPGVFDGLVLGSVS
jgi:hypothetical protein